MLLQNTTTVTLLCRSTNQTESDIYHYITGHVGTNQQQDWDKEQTLLLLHYANI